MVGTPPIRQSSAFRRGISSAQDYSRGHPALVAFAIILVASLVVAAIQGSKEFWWDSHGYWEFSEGFNHAGTFSFSHYTYDGLRGYALPLTYYGLHHGALHLGIGPGTDVNVFNAVLFALLGAVLAPALAAIAWPERRWGLVPRLALGALLLIFWSGYLSYPLSDFPALFAGVLALVAVSRVGSPAWLALAGLAAGYAINTRPAYLLLTPLLILSVFGWSWWRQRGRIPAGTGRRALSVVALVAGLARRHRPPVDLRTPGERQLQAVAGRRRLAGLQYSAGLKMQRPKPAPPSGRGRLMEHMEPSTVPIRRRPAERRVKDTGKYLEIIAENPVTMAGFFFAPRRQRARPALHDALTSKTSNRRRASCSAWPASSSSSRLSSA